MEMITTEYKHNGNTVRVHEPVRTQEEQAAFQRNLERATEIFLRKCMELEAKRAKEVTG